MSIENSAIHYIKDTMFGDFYLNNPLENKPLGRIFCRMVAFKSLENIKYLSPTSDFMQDMLEAFEEFDKNLNPPGLITKQFTELARKCADKGIEILIGTKEGDNKIACHVNDLKENKYLFINISEASVKEQMDKPIYVMQQTDNNIPEIKAIPLRELVGQGEIDENKILAKCTAYLLFHELFHANTFLEFSEWKEGKFKQKNSTDISKVQEHNLENISYDSVKLLLGGNYRGDDFRNVTGITKLGEWRVPGEFELLKALYPNQPTMRIYEGSGLTFVQQKIRNACVDVFNSIFKEELNAKNLILDDSVVINEIFQLHEELILTRLDYNSLFVTNKLFPSKNNEQQLKKLEDDKKCLNDKISLFKKFANSQDYPFVNKIYPYENLFNQLNLLYTMLQGKKLDSRTTDAIYTLLLEVPNYYYTNPKKIFDTINVFLEKTMDPLINENQIEQAKILLESLKNDIDLIRPSNFFKGINFDDFSTHVKSKNLLPKSFSFVKIDSSIYKEKNLYNFESDFTLLSAYV